MAIFEFSMVDYPRNHLRFMKSTKFEKHYIYVLIFISKMVLVESLRLLDYVISGQSERSTMWLKVVFTILYIVFSLISWSKALIRHFYSKVAWFSSVFCTWWLNFSVFRLQIEGKQRIVLCVGLLCCQKPIPLVPSINILGALGFLVNLNLVDKPWLQSQKFNYESKARLLRHLVMEK